MVRHFGRVSEREQVELHRGLMGGMSDSDRERVLRSAAARPDFWSTQLEKERDIVALMAMRQGSEDYTPDHSARNERYQLQPRPSRDLCSTSHRSHRKMRWHLSSVTIE